MHLATTFPRLPGSRRINASAPMLLLASASMFLLAACAPSDSSLKYPDTRMDSVVTTFHGTRVADPYRWLEDGTSAEVHAWIDSENHLTDSVLSRYADDALSSRVEALAETSPDRQSPAIVGTTLFYLRNTPPAPQPVLVAQPWPQGKEQVLVDVNDAGGSVAITGYWPSPRGRYVAFTTAMGGDELATLRFVDAHSGRVLSDTLPYAGGGTSPAAVAWDADESGVLFAQFKVPAGGQRVAGFDVSIRHHRLGDPGAPTPEVGQGLSPIVMWDLLTSDSGRRVAALAWIGDGSFAEVYTRDGGRWSRRVGADAGIISASFVGERLVLVATAGTPRGRVVGLTDTGELTDIVPEAEWAVQRVAPISGGMLLLRTWGMRTRIEHYRADGTMVRAVSLPDSAISIGAIASSAASPDALITYGGWTVPTKWVRYHGGDGTVDEIFAVTAPGDYGSVTVETFDATSADGTRVPVAVASLPGTPRDGSAPLILTGYGGFRNVYGPRFIGTSLAWLERGGVLAWADLRGGSSFGEAWHQGGMLTQKQHVFDDFYAAAQELVSRRWTSQDRFGITGGSNGGLLVGAAMTQHPEAYHAVVSFVGIYDMLRHETFPNGAYNTHEYGATSDSAQFAALYAYSPLHHVVRGTRYPAILMETGLNDPRVASWQSRKFTAALQAATTGGPVLLLTRSDAGHGIGAPFSQRVGNAAMSLIFFARELGLPNRQ